MNKADLPNNTAREPEEEAYQPSQVEKEISAPHAKKRKQCTFNEGTQSTEISSSQNTSSYKDALSQPAPGLTHRQRLLWLQKRREAGLWVQCDDCNRWRYLPHIVDSHELPNKWYCKMNPDHSVADCSVPEVPIKLRDEDDLIHSEYSAGSVVWARLVGWPWWPAMVDDCPDTEQFYWLDGFSDIPTHYNVVFFDAFEVTRAWIAPEYLKPYASNKKALKHVTKDKRYKKRLEVALKQADDADMLSLADRLNKYCFINRYKGAIGNPKKISKKILQKFNNKLKKQLNVDLVDDSDTETDVSSDPELCPNNHLKQAMKNKNVTNTGTSKTPKQTNKIQEKSNEKDFKINPSGAGAPSDNNVTTIEGNNNTEQSNDYFKQLNSMTVQVSSTPAFDTMNIDNDSSKTYVPDSELAPPSTVDLENHFESQKLQIRVATPSSDDFEF